MKKNLVIALLYMSAMLHARQNPLSEILEGVSKQRTSTVEPVTIKGNKVLNKFNEVISTTRVLKGSTILGCEYKICVISNNLVYLEILSPIMFTNLKIGGSQDSYSIDSYYVRRFGGPGSYDRLAKYIFEASPKDIETINNSREIDLIVYSRYDDVTKEITLKGGLK